MILIGGFQDIIEHCEAENFEIIGIIDNCKTGSYLGYKILGSDEDALDIYKHYSRIPVLIVPDSPQKRVKLSRYYQNIGFKFCNLISSRALISKSSVIGNGVIVRKGSNISSNVILGDFVHINTMANICHDSVIGAHTSIGPNAVITGGVKIGKECFIGANATILPNINIGNTVVIGAGAVVLNDVPDNLTEVGNPAHII